MQYSKEDTIKLKDGSIAIVMNKGLTGKEFSAKYNGQVVLLYSFIHSSNYIEPLICQLEINKINKTRIKRYWIFYDVMIGDIRAWLTEVDLETITMSSIKYKV